MVKQVAKAVIMLAIIISVSALAFGMLNTSATGDLADVLNVGGTGVKAFGLLSGALAFYLIIKAWS